VEESHQNKNQAALLSLPSGRRITEGESRPRADRLLTDRKAVEPGYKSGGSRRVQPESPLRKNRFGGFQE